MDWLTRSKMAYIYIEQSPLTVPRALAQKIKRCDILFGLPTIGLAGLEVKALTLYNDQIYIDAGEHHGLSAFEAYFNVTVWFMVIPKGEGDTCFLFRNRDLDRLKPIEKRGRAILPLPVCRTHAANMSRDFVAQLLTAVNGAMTPPA